MKADAIAHRILGGDEEPAAATEDAATQVVRREVGVFQAPPLRASGGAGGVDFGEATCSLCIETTPFCVTNAFGACTGPCGGTCVDHRRYRPFVDATR